MPIAYLVIMVVAMLSSIASMIMAALNKPKVPQLLPGAIDNVPVAEAGKSIPVVFGRRYVRQPNVVWWGDVKAVPITVNMGGKSGS